MLITQPQGLPHLPVNLTDPTVTQLLPLHTTSSPQSARPCSPHCHTLWPLHRVVAVQPHIVVSASTQPSPPTARPTRTITWPRPNPIAVPPHRPFTVAHPICVISTNNCRWTRPHRTHRQPRRHRPTTIRFWSLRQQLAPNTKRLSRTAIQSRTLIAWTAASSRTSATTAVRSAMRAIVVWD